MPTLIFVWLLTATAGALYLGKRLPKDYRAARMYSVIRLYAQRHRIAMRHFERFYLSELRTQALLLRADENSAFRAVWKDLN